MFYEQICLNTGEYTLEKGIDEHGICNFLVQHRVTGGNWGAIGLNWISLPSASESSLNFFLTQIRDYRVLRHYWRACIFSSLKEPYFVMATILWANVAVCKTTGSRETIIGTETYMAAGKESTCQCRRRKMRSLGREDLLEKEMVTQSSILAWEIPWTEEPGGLQSMGPQSQTQLSN